MLTRQRFWTVRSVPACHALSSGIVGVPLCRLQRYLGALFDGAHGIDLTFGKLHRNMWGAWAQLRQQYGKLQCSLSVGLLLRLYDACVPPTASYGCEVWGLRSLPAGDSRRGRAALASSHLKILKDIAGVPTSVHAAILLKELNQQKALVAAHSQVLEQYGCLACW